MSSPYISIIIPMFNTQEYIVRCLDSIVSQTYSGRIQCIIVDDCSTDDSMAVCQRYISQNSSKVEFLLIERTENRKQGAARNTGIGAADGDYVLFVDSDDTLPEDAVQSMVDVLVKYPKADMVQCGMEVTGKTTVDYGWADCRSWTQIFYSDNRRWITDTCAKELGMIPVSPVCKLINADFIRQNSIRFVEGMFYEDNVFLFLLSKHLRSVAFCHHNLYNYIIRENSTICGGKVVRVDSLKRMWLEIIGIIDDDFHPSSVLRKLESETSYYYNRANSVDVKRMILSIKIRLMRISPLSLKARIMVWMLCKPFMPKRRIPDSEQLLFRH